MDTTQLREKRIVRLPYDYGQRVWHRSRMDDIPGIVAGYFLRSGSLGIIVTWSDDHQEITHMFHELTTEWPPV